MFYNCEKHCLVHIEWRLSFYSGGDRVEFAKSNELLVAAGKKNNSENYGEASRFSE